MPALPLASSFLAGSLLSLLLPVALLIALVVWYVGVAQRAGRPGRPKQHGQVPVSSEDVAEAPEPRP